MSFSSHSSGCQGRNSRKEKGVNNGGERTVDKWVNSKINPNLLLDLSTLLQTRYVWHGIRNRLHFWKGKLCSFFVCHFLDYTSERSVNLFYKQQLLQQNVLWTKTVPFNKKIVSAYILWFMLSRCVLTSTLNQWAGRQLFLRTTVAHKNCSSTIKKKHSVNRICRSEPARFVGVTYCVNKCMMRVTSTEFPFVGGPTETLWASF